VLKTVLADAKLRKQILAIAVPIAISGLATQVQMLIDTAFLGHYSLRLADGTFLSGSDFLSAVGNVFFPYIVSLAFIWSLTTGTVVLVAQRLGARDADKARGYAQASIKYIGILSILVWAAWLLAAEPVFRLMGVREPILAQSLAYMRTMSLELLYLGFMVGAGGTFQGQGITRPEMYAGLLRSGINAFLDYCMIFGKLGFPEMGAAGAGLATSISGAISTSAFLAYFFLRRGSPVRATVRGVVAAPFRDFRDVAKVGLPTSLEDSLWNIGNLVIAGLLNMLMPTAVGIYRLVSQIEVTPIFFYTGIARAVTTLVGNRTGERDIPRAKATALAGSCYSLFLCLGFGALFAALPRQIVSIFSNDAALVAMAAPFLVITCVTMLPRSVNIVSGCAIRGYGDTLWMLATQVFGIAFAVGLTWALMFQAGLGMYGLFFALMADETVRGAINTARFYAGEYSIFHRAPRRAEAPADPERA
jgi:putative MATE family efflux protein